MNGWDDVNPVEPADFQRLRAELVMLGWEWRVGNATLTPNWEFRGVRFIVPVKEGVEGKVLLLRLLEAYIVIPTDERVSWYRSGGSVYYMDVPLNRFINLTQWVKP